MRFGRGDRNQFGGRDNTVFVGVGAIERHAIVAAMPVAANFVRGNGSILVHVEVRKDVRHPFQRLGLKDSQRLGRGHRAIGIRIELREEMRLHILRVARADRGKLHGGNGPVGVEVIMRQRLRKQLGCQVCAHDICHADIRAFGWRRSARPAEAGDGQKNSRAQ